MCFYINSIIHWLEIMEKETFLKHWDTCDFGITLFKVVEIDFSVLCILV